MSLKVDLGHLCLANTSTGLSVKASCVVTLSSPTSEPNPTQHNDPIEIRPTVLESCWIHRGYGCRMALQLDCGFSSDPSLDSARKYFVEGVETAITNAEFWSQLSLEPTLISSRLDEGSFTIGLRHAEEDVYAPLSKSHKHALRAPAAAVQPPKSVTSYGINEICISLSFATDDVVNTENLFDQSALDLVDNSLRLLILPDKVRLSRRVRLQEDEREALLSELSPALFRPRYLQALSRTAALIPTIARSLAKVQRAARSDSLQAKFDALCQHSAESEGSIVELKEDGSSLVPLENESAVETMHRTVWNSAQRHLRELQVTKALQPLRPMLDDWELPCSGYDSDGQMKFMDHPFEEIDWKQEEIKQTDSESSQGSKQYCSSPCLVSSQSPSLWSAHEEDDQEVVWSQQVGKGMLDLDNNIYGSEVSSDLDYAEYIDSELGDGRSEDSIGAEPHDFATDRNAGENAMDECILQSDPPTDGELENGSGAYH